MKSFRAKIKNINSINAQAYDFWKTKQIEILLKGQFTHIYILLLFPAVLFIIETVLLIFREICYRDVYFFFDVMELDGILLVVLKVPKKVEKVSKKGHFELGFLPNTN